MFGFLYLVIIAFLFGWVVDTFTGDKMPGKLWGTVFAALVGGLVGAYLPAVNHIGVNVNGVALLPAFLGTIVALLVMLGVYFFRQFVVDKKTEVHGN